MRKIWTVGYGAWPAAIRVQRLLAALTAAGVTEVVDTRISPCASSLTPEAPYGPRPWNLQAGEQGIAAILEQAGIRYDWSVELGNPQKRDPAMTVLRSHLADDRARWPVHRGLVRLAERVRADGVHVALLCACATPEACHRSLIASALRDRYFAGGLAIEHLGVQLGRSSYRKWR